MRKSSVYFFVVLTLLSLGLTLVPGAFSQISTTQDINVVNWSYYFSNGNLEVVGIAQNVGSNTITNVYLSGSIIDSNGVDQADTSSELLVEYLPPQQESPFIMTITSGPYSSPDGTWGTVDISNVDFQVEAQNATSNYQYPDLKVTSSSSTIGTSTSEDYAGAYLVNGVIKNTGNQTAQNIWVVGTFYNSTGSVIAVGFTDFLTTTSSTSLAPGGTVSFQVAALDLNQNQVDSALIISKYSLIVQSQEPVLQGAPTVTTSSSGSPSSGSSGSPSPGSQVVNSNSSSNVTAIAIVIVIVILAVVGILLAFMKRKPHQTVKEARKARKTSTS